jgi:hypothetical protein
VTAPMPLHIVFFAVVAIMIVSIIWTPKK